MMQFDKPENLNGFELVAELRTQGVKVIEPLVIDGNGDFWIDVSQSDAEKTAAIVATHNGTIMASEMNIADKLANVGLSIQELKAALS
jgi:hypothetical protein